MKILVVDDSALMRELIINQLKQAGYDDFVEAGNGTEAMGLLKHVDLVLSDLKMPGMSGLSFVREIRNSRNYSHIPVIIITSVNTVESVNLLVRSGVDDYIIKPYDQEKLVERVRAVEERLKKQAPQVDRTWFQ